jgi:hypothetical protein
MYGIAQRKEARASGEQLGALQSRLRRELEFAPDDRFVVAGKGDPDLHFDQVARFVRSSLVDKAQQFAVELAGDNLAWEAPVGRDEVERTLASLCVLNHAVGRLLDAGDEVRANDGEAIGLQGIERFEVAKKARKTARRRAPRVNRGRVVKKQTIDVSDRVDEFEVAFKFRADSATVQLFLEKCRAIAPALLLQDGFKVKAGRNSGDALTVTGHLVGLSVRDA